MYSEITHDLFKSIITDEDKPINSEGLEHAYKLYWEKAGVVLVSITNYIEPVTQYYVRDINA